MPCHAPFLYVITRFSILIGSSGGSSKNVLIGQCDIQAFQYPHRIVGGFKIGSGNECMSESKFQYPHRIVGGFKFKFSISGLNDVMCFSILIGSSGGSSSNADPFAGCGIVFQYPHRIVGGFKFASCSKSLKIIGFSILIGSSGGSRIDTGATLTLTCLFQYPHRIVGGFKSNAGGWTAPTTSGFSILIGSSGGSSRVFLFRDPPGL